MANTNKGRKFYIAVDTDNTTPLPQPTDLTQTDYEALTWLEVKNVGSIGESGTQTNIVSYDELSTDVTQKQKGISNAGDPPVEVARNTSDPGQKAMRAAAATKYLYAFKTEDADAPDESTTNSVYYNRGLVTGPTRPNGRNEDFNLEVFTLGLIQREIVVDPEPIAP
ncbi:tail tube protein [Mesorhizobium sp. J18]|uniref:phage tail tube protein n=1 Tax=Mesorhizobium sp. J18 TaxID=935263 RepID=UPI00119B07D1|nr:phage tail tube protein [Mesorhizobium sp. J18]TWG90317.1 tail tube protein [Mesorhizobium sp. J18]